MGCRGRGRGPGSPLIDSSGLVLKMNVCGCLVLSKGSSDALRKANSHRSSVLSEVTLPGVNAMAAISPK